LHQESPHGNQLEDIHVRKLVDNFQSVGGRISVLEADLGKVKAVQNKVEDALSDSSAILLSGVKKADQQRPQSVIVNMADSGETTTDPMPSPPPTDSQRRAAGKSPEKPARRSRDKSTERTLAGGDSGSNVMSIVSRLNAMAL
jgi:hypothetical protein